MVRESTERRLKDRIDELLSGADPASDPPHDSLVWEGICSRATFFRSAAADTFRDGLKRWDETREAAEGESGEAEAPEALLKGRVEELKEINDDLIQLIARQFARIRQLEDQNEHLRRSVPDMQPTPTDLDSRRGSRGRA